MVLTQEEILLSLVQGDEGKNWALNRIGWKKFSIEPGKAFVALERLFKSYLEQSLHMRLV